MGEPLLPIVAEIGIDKPIDKVWDVLTGAATVPLWLGAMDYQPELGTTFFMQQDPEKQATHDTDGATWCDVVLLQKPHKFDFSWYVPGTEATMVQISLFQRETTAPSCGCSMTAGTISSATRSRIFTTRSATAGATTCCPI